MNTEYKKGVLELCVLSLLFVKDYYGYEISPQYCGIGSVLILGD